jgi:alpha-L-rhamnosidase
MYRYMCGLNPIEEAAGYKKARITPRPDPRIKKVAMIRDTAAGRYEIEWEFRWTVLHFRIVIPFDCEALIDLPGKEEMWVSQGEYVWDCPRSLCSVM